MWERCWGERKKRLMEIAKWRKGYYRDVAVGVADGRIETEGGLKKNSLFSTTLLLLKKRGYCKESILHGCFAYEQEENLMKPWEREQRKSSF